MVSKSIFAGIAISLGCLINLYMSNPIIGALLFSFGLLCIFELDMRLYTGYVGYNKFNISNYFKVLLSNIVGVSIVTVLIHSLSNYSDINNKCTEIIGNKMSHSIIETFIRSMICGSLISIAVYSYKKSRNYISVIMCVMIFILTGMDHCIANYFYIINSSISANLILLAILNIVIWIVGNTIGSFILVKGLKLEV